MTTRPALLWWCSVQWSSSKLTRSRRQTLALTLQQLLQLQQLQQLPPQVLQELYQQALAMWQAPHQLSAAMWNVLWQLYPAMWQALQAVPPHCLPSLLGQQLQLSNQGQQQQLQVGTPITVFVQVIYCRFRMDLL